MSNRLDKLFKDNILKHHLPNDGPNWAGLEAKMKGKSRKPFLFLGWSTGIVIIGLVTLYLLQGQQQGTTNTTENKYPVIQNNKADHQVTKKDTHENVNPSSSDKIENIPAVNSIPKTNASGQPAPGNASPIIAVTTPVKEANPPKENTHIPDVTKTTTTMEDSIRSIKLAKKANVMPADTSITEVPPSSTIDSVVAPKPVIAGIPVNPLVRKMISPKRHLISIYAMFTPAFINSKDVVTIDPLTHKSYTALRLGGEKMKNALGMDLGVRFAPFKRFSFTTGIIYEKRSETVNYHFLIDEGPVIMQDSIKGYFQLSPSASERIDYSTTNTYSYVGIPLSVNFDLSLLKWIGLGLQLNGSYLRQTSLQGKTIDKTYLELVDLTSKNSTQLKNIFNAGLGLNLRFPITNNLFLNITPDYKKQLTKNAQTSSPKQTTLKIGLQYFIF